MTTKTLAKPATPAQQKQSKQDRDALVATLVSKWDTTTVGEIGALQTLADAQLAVDNIRVIKCRIFYTIADLLQYQGKPSLAGATKALNKGSDSKKNSYRPYLAAGQALRDAGFNLRTTTPDAEEREIVEKAWNAHKRSVKQEERDAKKAAEEKASGTTGEGETQGNPPADDDAATFSAVLAMFARANSVLDTYVAGGGIVTTDDVDTTAAIFSKFAQKLVGLAQ
jgi:hypothetical protein